ncbi:alpha/beta hydrolase family protein [Mycobacterium sp. WMMD1722]|uniref:alpha/beta hydrolase family protein n=1 Tax=Mycobacterium sp. WMMD1722 TaxID=3404117 RepID=UPI003BF4A8F4
MKVYFKDDSFAFEFVRNLGYAYYGGSDIGELYATVEDITEGDLDSWHDAWLARGKRVAARAKEYLEQGHLVSARGALLRASTYYRVGEFYLHGNPEDPRILEEAKTSADLYSQAAELTGPTWEKVEIPYEGTTLPGYFYKSDESNEPRPTLIFHGGYDSSVEELYYFAAAGAVARGYNCLTWDGPGQGLPVREQKLYFRYDWEKVVTPAVDYVLSRPDVDPERIALKGMSLGGYLAARAAAFEPRLKAAILFDGVWSLYDSIVKIMGDEAAKALEDEDADTFNKLAQKLMDANTQMRWTFDQGTWSFGQKTPYDFMVECKKMTLDGGIPEKITCPTLVMEADGDQFFKGQPERVYDALTNAPKTFVAFHKEDGAENHCQSGALAFKDEVVFNWLDDTFKA